MDLVAIGQTVRRHKFAALPVIILTVVLAAYVMVLSKPDYTAVGVYAVVNPPAAPTQAQIAHDPALGKVNANSPLVAYGSLSVVGYMITESVNAHVMAAAGINPASTVTNDLAVNAPVVTVTGAGVTAAEAVHSAVLLGQVLTNKLNSIQAGLGVSRAYRVTLVPLQAPDHASLKLSSKLRDLIGVLALGAVLLWVSVSIAVARAERKKASALSADAFDSAAWQGSQGIPPVGGSATLGVDGAGNVHGANLPYGATVRVEGGANGNGTNHAPGESARSHVTPDRRLMVRRSKIDPPAR